MRRKGGRFVGLILFFSSIIFGLVTAYMIRATGSFLPKLPVAAAFCLFLGLGMLAFPGQCEVKEPAYGDLKALWSGAGLGERTAWILLGSAGIVLGLVITNLIGK